MAYTPPLHQFHTWPIQHSVANQSSRATALFGQRGAEVQPYRMHSRAASPARVAALKQILADTIALRELVFKHRWQSESPQQRDLLCLFEANGARLNGLIEALGDRIRVLSGVSIVATHGVAELSRVPRPVRGCEEPLAQIARLLEAHELVLDEAGEEAQHALEAGDTGTHKLLRNAIRVHQHLMWNLAEHLVDSVLVWND